MTMEKRSALSRPELRSADTGRIAEGYAALFNSRAVIGDFFEEMIAPGAFTQSLSGDDILALVGHDTARVIGRSSAKTLRLREDARGLFVEIDLPDTTDGRDLAVQLERGDICGMSFGFSVTHEEWDETGAIPLRTVHAVKLYEVSAVAFPAYPDTSIGLRSLDAARLERRKLNFNAAAIQLRMKADLDLRLRSRSRA